jgi:DNA polymerase
MIVTLDFETYYSKDYSLTKLSEADYILDPRFQTIMCAIKIGSNPSKIAIGHDQCAQAFAEIDWSRAALLAHNTRFDGSILYWIYGYTPAMYLDTLGMARALTHAVLGKSSLKAVSDYLGLPAKGEQVHQAIGKRLENFTPQELLDYVDYCLRDNDNCYDIFQRFKRVFPTSELVVIDAVLRMFIEPRVLLEPNVLALHLAQTRAEFAQCLNRVAHIDKKVFSSNAQFAELLEQHGVDVPMKISPTTGLEIPAIAKNDREFKELCADDSQPMIVQTLLAARVATKSTIEETRTAKMLAISLKQWPVQGQGWLPVPLRYYGAHTGRLSGDGGINLQNLKRGSRIREAIQAPTGYRIVHRDSSQIEARMVAWLAQCLKLLDAFANGRDVYSEFASTFYRMNVTKADKIRRFVGKTSILGLGYGMGGPRFRHTLFIGNGGVSVAIDFQEANRLVYHYRREYPEIPKLWENAGWMLEWMIKQLQPIDPAVVVRSLIRAESHGFSSVIRPSAEGLWLPNGLCIAYPNLRHHQSLQADGSTRREVVYDNPYGIPKKLFGGKVVENVSQALARIIITDIVVRVKERTKWLPFMTTHDSLDYCVPESEAQLFDDLLDQEFRVRPAWARDLPLASEGGFGRNLTIAENEHHAEHNS